MIKILQLMACLLISLTAGGVAHSQQKANIGVILPLTGNTSFIGEDIRKGMELSLSQKDSFSFIYEDSAGINERCISAFQSLSAIYQPILLISANCAEVLAPIVDSKGIPLLITLSSSSNITKDRQWVFRYFTNADIDAKAMAEYVGEQAKYKRIAILHVEDQFGFDYLEVFKNTIGRYDGDVPISDSFQYSETDFKTHLLRIKSKSPDAIYLIGLDYQILSILKTMKQLKVDLPVFAVGTVATHTAIEKAEGLLENVYVTAFCTDGPPPSFRKEYEDRYQSKPGFFAEVGSDITHIVRDAIQRKGTSREEIKEGLASVRSLSLNSGNISTGENGEIVIPICVKQIIGGRIKNLHTGKFSDY